MHKTIVGLQWGDEGKGKLVDVLTQEAVYIVRFQGGNNAGHTVVVRDETFKFHLLPSGILYADKVCVIGNGVVVNPAVLCKELDDLEKHPEVISEGIQTILRREGNKDAYEKLMALTQGKKTTMEELRRFIQELDVTPTVREELLQLTPANYTGLASRLVEQNFKN